MINKAILVGNVGADPEVRSLESGVKVCRIRLATTERVRKDDGWADHTEWHTVVLWRNLADIADKYIRRGSRIYVEGPLRSNEWTDKEGNRRVTIEIIASELKLLDRRADGDSAPRPAASAAPAPATPKPVVPPTVSDEDDLPF